MKRLFIAVGLPDETKAALTGLQQVLRPYFIEATWVRPEGLHLTLKFLGDTPEDRIPTIQDACGRAVRPFSAFSMELKGVGVFPDWRRPRVLWVGVQTAVETLGALQAAVERAVEPLGYPPETRPFIPHLTLARVKRSHPAVLQKLREREKTALEGSYGVIWVRQVTLFESRLHPQGAVYTPLAHFPLGWGG
ncbi:MAG: RNA 2',3'-cyclic phosphodiesterase [Acidobacteria bacterium]|nr:RNA 2',3'-cyclic phosphodiesterase [Acidobacteriota bacterium]MDW7984186.1 RNA 2',3'-cyclic phosphodiesterase [Acidobacteriota bacterium]